MFRAPLFRPERTPISFLFLGVGLLGVVFGHCTLQLLLYQARCFSPAPLFKSDFIVFGIPPLLALATIALLLFRSPLLRKSGPVTRLIGVLIVSFAVAVLSLWASLLLPFNLYGT